MDHVPDAQQGAQGMKHKGHFRVHLTTTLGVKGKASHFSEQIPTQKGAQIQEPVWYFNAHDMQLKKY